MDCSTPGLPVLHHLPKFAQVHVHGIGYYFIQAEVMELDAIMLVFLIFSFKPTLSLSSFTLIKRLFSSSSLSAIRVVSSAYLRLLMFLPPILIPAYNSSSPAFLRMCSAHRLNKQGGSRQPYHTPFSVLNKSVVPNPFLVGS